MIFQAYVVQNSANFSSNILLGSDFLRRAKSILNFSENYVSILNRRFPFLPTPSNTPPFAPTPKTTILLHASSDFHVPPYSQLLINAYCKAPPGEYIVRKNCINNSLFIAESLVNNVNFSCPVLVTNVHNHVQYVRLGTILATAEVADDINDESVLAVSFLPNDQRTLPVPQNQKSNTKLRSIRASDLPGLLIKDDKYSLLKLLNSHRQAISLPGDPLGLTNLLQHDIRIKDDSIPIHLKQYRIPHKHIDILNNAIQDMLDLNVIKPSTSPWNSPIILVKNKNGSFRVCVDFRRLNSITIPCRYPLPRLDEALQCLHGAQYFSTLDLKKAFYQVPLTDSAAEKTAFSTAKGKFQFTRLPFGLVDSPAVFSALMAQVLQPILGIASLVYLDDIIVFSKSKDEHFTRLSQVLSLIQNAGLTISLDKCVFLKTSVPFLGHVITASGIQYDSSKATVIREFPACKSKDDIKRFLGFMSFYRTFIPGFADIAYPLTKLLQKKEHFVWNNEQCDAFRALKDSLLRNSTLVYPDYTAPFYLFTDASNTALGACLAQKHVNKFVPISFASRTLNETEQRYSTTKREALGLLWALKHFRFVVFGYELTILTDHKPLIGLFNNTLPSDAALSRWVLLIQEFQPKIEYLPGKDNIHADILSRFNKNINHVPYKDFTEDEFDEFILCNDVPSAPASPSPVHTPTPTPVPRRSRRIAARRAAEPLSLRPTIPLDSGDEYSRTSQRPNPPLSHPRFSLFPDCATADVPLVPLPSLPLPSTSIANPKMMSSVTTLPHGTERNRVDTPPSPLVSESTKADVPCFELCSNAQMRVEQRNDPHCSHIIDILTNPPAANKVSKFPSYFMKDGILYFRRQVSRANIMHTFVNLEVPTVLVPLALKNMHNPIHFGHHGTDRTLWRLRQFYHFPRERKRVNGFIRRCPSCITFAVNKSPHAPVLEYPIPNVPFEVISADLVGPLPISPSGNRFLLVVTCFLTRYAVLVPIPNKTAISVSEAFRTHVFKYFSAPKTILTDNGREFKNASMKSLCNLYGTRLKHVAPYHPASNGLVERTNQKVIRIMKKYVGNDSTWDSIVPEVQTALNSTFNASLKTSPHHALFGFEKRLIPNDELGANDFYTEIRGRLPLIWDQIRSELQTACAKYRVARNKRRQEKPLPIGTTVYVKKTPKPEEFKKFSPNYEGPFTIEEHISKHKYRVKNEKTTRIVHRNSIFNL